MNGPQKFEPPEAVVGPAFSELMNRLARSRGRTPSNMGMSEEERKIFEYGVSERKRVLEHTLFLVFGQWAVYRQGVSRLQSRASRITYAAGAFVSTAYFVGARARRVSQEMFATIATAGITSPLGNEARVVLAELEGPDGPYFRKICSEKAFKEDITAAMASLDAKEGVDLTADNLHPQLRLRPRLGVAQPRIAGGTQGDDRGESRREGDRDPRIRRRDLSINNETNTIPGIRGSGNEWQERNKGSSIVRGTKKNSGESESSGRQNNGNDSDTDIWGRPFDFAKAAIEPPEYDQQDEIMRRDNEFGTDDRKENEMTPGQRRAAERRMKRMKGRGRDSGNGNGGIE